MYITKLHLQESQVKIRCLTFLHVHYMYLCMCIYVHPILFPSTLNSSSYDVIFTPVALFLAALRHSMYYVMCTHRTEIVRKTHDKGPNSTHTQYTLTYTLANYMHTYILLAKKRNTKYTLVRMYLL
jgi:hypothetical protein